MGNSQLDYELYNLIRTFIEAAIFLYQIYTPHFKITALLILAYLAFKAGRATVADPIEQKVHKIQNILQNRSQFTIVLPKKIKTISRTKKVILGFLTVGIIAVVSLQFIDHDIVRSLSFEDILLGSGTLFVLVVFLWLYEAILKFKLAKGNFNDHHINQKMQQIVQMLGIKAEGLLKLFLNRDQMMKSQRRPTGHCSKEKCQQYRKLLKEKQEGISAVVDETLTFEWCSVCKKRIVFDEFLNFQANPYNKQDLPVDEDVKERNAYLMNEVDRMTKWVKNIGPCNCSRRYWSESTRAIMQFKKREKQVDSRLAMFQAKLPKTDTAYRMSE